MKVLAYFTFTFLSVVIQFAVMEYNQERMQLQLEDKSTFMNLTRIKKDTNTMDKVKKTQHALFYRTPARLIDVNSIPEENETSTIFTKMDKTTADPFSNTLFDILLEDEDVTDVSMTSEYPLTSTEYENVTEFSIFTKNNSTTTSKPDLTPIKPDSINCQCDLLYNICDVNCCCDVDCSQQQMELFHCSFKKKTADEFLCSSIPLDSEGYNDLFCIAKTNIPEKRNKAHFKYNAQIVKKQLQQSFKWRHYAREDNKIEFTKKPYSRGDPIWLFRNGSVAYLDVPSASLNSFCGRRKAVTFLKDEEFKCSVVDTKLLEMFSVLNQIEETVVISVPPGNISSTVMNCSTLHCTKWEILVCNYSTCIKYNKSLHDPVCTGDVCTNLALNMEYVFYYHNFTITNASIHLHVQNSTQQTFTQYVSIKFYITDKKVGENMIQLSGNPGYDNYLPVIISTAKQNHTEYFFNSTSKTQNVYIYPKNVKGSCVKNNLLYNKLEFNVNRRTKCLFNMMVNKTNACESIQSALQQFMGLDKNIWISPLGNPHAVGDDEWISLKMPELLPVGQMVTGTTVYCENLISTISLSFGFADIGDEDNKVNKIFTSDVSVVTRNVTFDLDNVYVLLTYESIFIDVTKPPDYQFAAGPHLNIRLPNDFFFPFP